MLAKENKKLYWYKGAINKIVLNVVQVLESSAALEWSSGGGGNKNVTTFNMELVKFVKGIPVHCVK